MKSINKNHVFFLSFIIIIGIILFLVLKPKSLTAQSCLLTGDVNNNIELNSVALKELSKVETNGEKYNGFSLNEMVESAKPLSDEYSVILMGYDGLYAKLKGNELDDCFIVLKDYHWNTVAKNHPVNANIKNLKEVIVVDESNDLSKGVNIINQDKNIVHITPGNMLLDKLEIYPYLDGETQQDNGNSVSLYKQKKVKYLQDYAEEKIDNVLVMTYEGDYRYYSATGYLELDNNQINYLIPEEREVLNNISGIIINPPAQSLLDTYYDAVHYIDKGEKVMLVYIDGLSYSQYEKAKEMNRIPNIMGLGDAIKINTVFKPVTNAGFSAMITGQPPSINGIMDRSIRTPSVETIFDYLEEKEAEHVLIESNIGILDLNTKTIFSVDANNDGNTDKEVFNNTMKELKYKPDFILVHFHGVDDAGHTYGDLHHKTMDTLMEVDTYIGDIIDEWNGKIIITSDHGMHSIDEHGDHGSFRVEDIMIPYIIR